MWLNTQRFHDDSHETWKDGCTLQVWSLPRDTVCEESEKIVFKVISRLCFLGVQSLSCYWLHRCLPRKFLTRNTKGKIHEQQWNLIKPMFNWNRNIFENRFQCLKIKLSKTPPGGVKRNTALGPVMNCYTNTNVLRCCLLKMLTVYTSCSPPWLTNNLVFYLPCSASRWPTLTMKVLPSSHCYLGPKVYPEVPDGGWGWAVAVAFFMVEVCTYGTIKSLGVFLQDLMDEFGESNSRVSWVISICVFVFSFTGLSLQMFFFTLVCFWPTVPL